MYSIACIDIGTVTARLALAQFADEKLCAFEKVSVICNLGEGLSAPAQSALSDKAMQRTLAAVEGFVQKAHSWAQSQVHAEIHFVCTLTSAARDAQNASTLLDALRALGLEPQILSGKLEAYLTFSAVSSDFIDKPLVVCDCGGGSTELIYGMQRADRSITIYKLCSMQLGARRVTDSFLQGQEPLLPEALRQAYDYCCSVVYNDASWLYDDTVPARVPPYGQTQLAMPRDLHFVAVGGTATSLVAMEHKLVPYNASRVHLATLSSSRVHAWLEHLEDMTEDQRAQIVGLQPKRASVILGGTMVLDAILSTARINVMQVSEHDLLQGVAYAVYQTCRENQSFVEWLEQKAELL